MKAEDAIILALKNFRARFHWSSKHWSNLMYKRLAILPSSIALLLTLYLYAMGAPAAAKGYETEPHIRPVGPISLQTSQHEGRAALQVKAEGGLTGNDRLVHLPVPNFRNGVITGFISGQPVADAAAGARGFVGIAFKTQQDGGYEAFYIRPTNGRSDDQLRRNRSTQYISHPEFTWERLRSEAPGVYESYADMEPGRWISFRIEVNGAHARLFLNDAPQPALVVNNLKRGPSEKGGTALWVGPETLAHFADIRIVKHD